MDHPVSLGAAEKIPQGRARGSPTDPPLPADRPVGQTVTPWLMVVLIVVLFSGGLFGYDQGVISGALHGIKARFSLSSLIVEVVTSWVTLGALFGALAGGELADRIGRKRAVLIAGALFTLGSLVQALAPETVILVAGRLIVGAGVGVAAVAAPLYAAELAPTSLRGRFVSAYQLAITVGIFLAYLVDGWLSKSNSWRLMLGASAAPGLLLFVVALVAPESPRWLMKMNRRADAAMQIHKIRPGVDFKPRLDAIETALREESGRASWGDVFRREWRRPVDDRRRARRVPTNHRHQCDHLLRRPDLRGRRLYLEIIADDGDHLGDWRCQRARDPNCRCLHRPSGATETAARRADRNGGQPGGGRDRLPVHCEGRCRRRLDRAERGRDCHPVRTGRFHHLLRLFDGAGHLDRDQRSLPRAHPRPRRRGRHGGQLGRGVLGQSVLPVADRGDGNFMDLRTIRAVLRRRLDMDLLPCAGDKRTVSGTDPTALEGDAVRPIAGDIGGATTRCRFTSVAAALWLVLRC